MTDSKLVARVLREFKSILRKQELVKAFCQELVDDDPNFDAEQFKKACEMP